MANKEINNVKEAATEEKAAQKKSLFQKNEKKTTAKKDADKAE